MTDRVAFWLALAVVALAIYGALCGCATLEEQDAQRREDIEQWHEIRSLKRRVSDIEAGRNEPAPPEWQYQAGDGR